MTDKFYSVEELADEVNSRSEQLLVSNSDKRSSETLSVRRIRDYASKKFIDKPEKIGREARYTETHVTQLLALRSLQSEGISERYINQQIDLKDVDATTSYVASKTASQAAIMTDNAPQSVMFSARGALDKSNLFSSYQDDSGVADFANHTAKSMDEMNPALAAIRSVRLGSTSTVGKRGLTNSLTGLTNPLTGLGASKSLDTQAGTVNVLTKTMGRAQGALPVSSQPAKVRQWNLASGRVRLTAEEGSFSDDDKKQLEQQIVRIIKEQM